MNLKQIPGISFIRRYWWVLTLVLLSYTAMRSDSLFQAIDLFVYLPIAFALWVGFPLLWRNIFNSKTTDRFVEEKQAQKGFESLSQREKTWFNMIQMGFYLVGSAIIVAGFVIAWLGQLIG